MMQTLVLTLSNPHWAVTPPGFSMWKPLCGLSFAVLPAFKNSSAESHQLVQDRVRRPFDGDKGGAKGKGKGTGPGQKGKGGKGKGKGEGPRPKRATAPAENED